jgi:hypothetical protein
MIEKWNKKAWLTLLFITSIFSSIFWRTSQIITTISFTRHDQSTKVTLKADYFPAFPLKEGTIRPFVDSKINIICIVCQSSYVLDIFAPGRNITQVLVHCGN